MKVDVLESFAVQPLPLCHTLVCTSRSTATAGLGKHKLTANTSFLPKLLPRCLYLYLNTISDLLQTRLVSVHEKIWASCTCNFKLRFSYPTEEKI